nr:hypothetical protein [Leptospira alstonii]
MKDFSYCRLSDNPQNTDRFVRAFILPMSALCFRSITFLQIQETLSARYEMFGQIYTRRHKIPYPQVSLCFVRSLQTFGTLRT